MTMLELAKQFQAEWAIRSKDNNPFRFIDKAGRAWENARYIQMLTRTTAQRVETAAFCDSMLADGFPLARISNDSGNDCDVCGAWEGRLIDLTPGHQLGSGTYTLREAREAGLFHPNCTHRLEYVSVAEIPENIFAKIKDKIGIPGAFGDNKTATKPDLPTNAQRKEHIKQVEEAAEEKAKEEVQTKIRASLEKKGVILDKSLKEIGQRLLNVNYEKLDSLLEAYPIVGEYFKKHESTIQIVDFDNVATFACVPKINTGEKITIQLSRKHYQSYERHIAEVRNNVNSGWFMPCEKNNYTTYVLTHEFGHILQNILIEKEITRRRKNQREGDHQALLFGTIANEQKEELINIMKSLDGNITDDNLHEHTSGYSDWSSAEFFAEAFANAENGATKVMGDAMRSFLKRRLK